jgi:hypothetical protein
MKFGIFAAMVISVMCAQADACDKCIKVKKNKRTCITTIKAGRLRIPILDLRCVTHKAVDLTADVAEGAVGVVGGVVHGTHSLLHRVLFPCCKAHTYRPRSGVHNLVHWEPCDLRGLRVR